MSKVLIVDDEPSICWALEQALGDDGHDVLTSATAEDAIHLVSESNPDVIVMDIRLPGLDGLTALQRLRDQLDQTPVVMITAFGSLDTAVQAVQQGAFEYLTKPFDLDDAVAVIQRALDSRKSSTSEIETRSANPLGDQLLLGSSPAMQEIFRKIAYVSKHDVPVLITGESGTGKELVAAAIHQYSDRSQGPFVPVCIPAMNESMVESELFGHTKGAFTGAVSDRDGMLTAANKGTAFFDEIGDIGTTTQVKLLRVLETKVVTPVGGNSGRQSDFRLVAATNRQLDELVATEQFREDLFYRLNVYRIEIPPLRERREDIPLLAEHFMRRLDPDANLTFSKESLEELKNRNWKGNVRELRNAVEHAAIVTRSGDIRPDAFPAPFTDLTSSKPTVQSLHEIIRDWWEARYATTNSPGEAGNIYDAFLAEVEPVLLEKALEVSEGNRQEAARLLGMHRQTLRDKLKKYGLNEKL